MKPGKIITVGVPLITTACFLAICWLGWQRVVADQAREVGYTELERRQLASLFTRAKPVVLWNRADVLADVWGVTSTSKAEAVLKMLDKERYLANTARGAK